MVKYLNFNTIWTVILLGLSVFSCHADPMKGMFFIFVIFIPIWLLGLTIHSYVYPNENYKKNIFYKEKANNIQKATHLYESIKVVFWIFVVGYLILHLLADIPITLWGTVGGLVLLGLLLSGVLKRILAWIFSVDPGDIDSNIDIPKKHDIDSE